MSSFTLTIEENVTFLFFAHGLSVVKKDTPSSKSLSLYNYVPSSAISSFSLYFFSLSLYLWFVDLELSSPAKPESCFRVLDLFISDLSSANPRSRRKSQQQRCFSPIREYQSQVFEVLKGFFVKVFFPVWFVVLDLFLGSG